MNPGATIRPLASKTSASPAAENVPAAATSAIFSPSKSTSLSASVLLAASRTRPFLTRSMRWVLYVGSAAILRRLRFRRRVLAIFRVTGSQQKEQRHAHRETVGHLIEHAGLRAVGNLRRNFDPAIHRAGMQHERVGASAPQAFRAELRQQDVVLGRKCRFVQAFRLHAQNKNHIRTLQRFFDPKDTANRRSRWSDFLELLRDPHRGAAQRKPAPELPEQMNVGARHPAVLNIAKNGDVEIADAAFAVANRERVQQALRRMLVRSVAGVDHRNIQMPGDKVGSAGSGVAQDQTIRLHGIQRVHGVQQRLAFFQAGRFRLQVHGVRAKSRGGRAKAEARARGVLEKSQGNGLSAKGRKFFQRMALNFLKRFALIEEKCEFVRVERLQRQEVTKTVRHLFTRCANKLAPQLHSTRSTSTTRSSWSISRSRTSMISVGLVCTTRPVNCDSMGISRWPRSISTHSDTRFGRPRWNRPFIAARIVRPV